MIVEEVARQNAGSSSAPDNSNFERNFGQAYLENRAVILAEILYFVSGEHDTRGGGTTKRGKQLCS